MGLPRPRRTAGGRGGGRASLKTLCALPLPSPPKRLGIGLRETPPSFPEETSRVTRNFLLPPLSPFLHSPRKDFFYPTEDILVLPSLRRVFRFGEGGFPRGNLIPRWAAKETFAAFLSQGIPSPLRCPRRCFFGVHPRKFFVSCFYEFSRLAFWHLKFVFMILNFNLFGIFLEQGRRI